MQSLAITIAEEQIRSAITKFKKKENPNQKFLVKQLTKLFKTVVPWGKTSIV